MSTVLKLSSCCNRQVCMWGHSLGNSQLGTCLVGVVAVVVVEVAVG